MLLVPLSRRHILSIVCAASVCAVVTFLSLSVPETLTNSSTRAVPSKQRPSQLAPESYCSPPPLRLSSTSTPLMSSQSPPVVSAQSSPPGLPVPKHRFSDGLSRVDAALIELESALAEMDLGSSDSPPPNRQSLPAETVSAFNEYSRRHQKIMAGDASVPQKYLAWSIRDYGGAGFGNRIIGMISALGLALVSGRAFLLPFDPVLSPVIQAVSPAFGGIDWSLERAEETFRRVRGRKMRSHHLQLSLTMENWCACDDWLSDQGPFADVDIVTMESTQYFWPCVTHNPSLRSIAVAALGPSVALFRPAILRFIRLASELEDEVDRFDKEVLRRGPDRRLVGLQIRTEHLIQRDREIEVFFNCAQMVSRELQDAEKLSALSGGTVAEALSSLRTLLQRGGLNAVPSNSTSVFFFLATDDVKVRSMARSVFGDNLFVYDKPGHIHTPGAAAVIDTWLLSRMDRVIITWPKSTFGSVGAALVAGNTPPFAVVSGSKRSNECIRLLSTEPCFHGWYARSRVRCYAREGFETPEMLNQHNCYMCLERTSTREVVCPASDTADAFLQPANALDHESVVSLGGAFWVPTGLEHALGSFAEDYDQWKRDHPGHGRGMP